MAWILLLVLWAGHVLAQLNGSDFQIGIFSTDRISTRQKMEYERIIQAIHREFSSENSKPLRHLRKRALNQIRQRIPEDLPEDPAEDDDCPQLESCCGERLKRMTNRVHRHWNEPVYKTTELDYDHCPVLYEDPEVDMILMTPENCGHWFCKKCYEQVQNDGKFKCPMCRVESSNHEEGEIVLVNGRQVVIRQLLKQPLKSRVICTTKQCVLAFMAVLTCSSEAGVFYALDRSCHFDMDKFVTGASTALVSGMTFLTLTIPIDHLAKKLNIQKYTRALVPFMSAVAGLKWAGVQSQPLFSLVGSFAAIPGYFYFSDLAMNGYVASVAYCMAHLQEQETQPLGFILAVLFGTLNHAMLPWKDAFGQEMTFCGVDFTDHNHDVIQVNLKPSGYLTRWIGMQFEKLFQWAFQ